MAQTCYLGSARTLVAAILLSTQLAACLGSVDPKTSDEVVDDLSLSGNVGDGPVVGASMRVIQNNGVELATFESDANANYLVNVSSTLQYYPLVIESTGGIDIVTNLPPDFVLESAVFAPASRSVANVNPFSTYAVALARQLPGGLTESNLESAQSTVSSVLNGGLNDLAMTGPMVTHIDEDNISEVVKASETVAETIRRTRDLLNAFGFNTAGDQILRAIASDITDNVVDGRGGSNSDGRMAAVMTIVTAQVYLESMANELFVNGSNATNSIDAAIMQVSVRTPTVTLEELSATREMIGAARLGLAAAFAIDTDTRISGLHASISGLQHGMSPSLVRTLLPADYRSILQNALNIVAGGNAAIIDIVNNIARGDGGLGPDNRAPSIQGTPTSAVVAGSNYSFSPSAADPDGDTLSFSISNQPSWASFDSTTGQLSGTPSASDVGFYSNILISVSDGEFTASLAAFSINVTMSNSAPSISGTPSSAINVGIAYAFTPTATDPDGDNLTFSVFALPPWASFNASNGRISGTPTAGDVGAYGGIRISVSDGSLSDELGPFSITVDAISNGSVTLNWTAPTENEDGTVLVDLAGFRIYWGTTPGNYPNSVTINNASISTYVVDNLAPGTYEFVATSFNTSGVESIFSNSTTKVVP